jgi:hypothetical protein
MEKIIRTQDGFCRHISYKMDLNTKSTKRKISQKKKVCLISQRLARGPQKQKVQEKEKFLG